MQPKRKKHLILFVEDDDLRMEALAAWLPEDFRAVQVRSAGRAMGVLSRSERHTFAAVMLDHDLQMHAATAEDRMLSSSDLTDLIATRVSKRVPVLVHSMNPSRAPVIAGRLSEYGFDVVQIPFDQLSQSWIEEWLNEARELYADLVGEAE